MAAVILLAAVDAPVWTFALVLVAWGVAGAVWFQNDAVAILRQIHDATLNGHDTDSYDANWHNWVCGWYWEIDAHQQWRILQPGVGAPPGIQVDWANLSEFVAKSPPLSSAWRGGLSAEGDAGCLGYCLDQKLAWPDALELPWPDALPGLPAPAEGWRCLFRGEPRWDAAGRFLGFRGTMQPLAPRGGQTDVPPQPSADATLAAEALQDAAQNAQMREAEQEVLRYALSHDLRAPLRVVEGFTRIVQEDYGKLLDKLGNDHLERVLTAAARMNGMIDAILAQAELSAEPLQRVPVDLSALARDIGAEQGAAQRTGAPAVVLDVAEGLCVEADPLLVRRVMENLISNALKYSAKVEAPRVEVGAMPATNPTVFFVRDNGAGFDMQHADKLFGMFQRLHSAKEFPGTGVGLAGVRNIVRRHGGRIWAEAKPGEGACFYFTLMGAVEAQQRAAKPSR